MIPSRQTVVALLIGSVLLALSALIPLLLVVAFAWVCMIAVLCLLDLVTLPKLASLRIRRRLPKKFSLNVPARVDYHIENNSSATRRIQLAENWPEAFVPDSPSRSATVQAGARGDIPFTVTPAVRGDFTLKRLDVRLMSFMGFWWRQTAWGQEDPIRVYPNLRNFQTFEIRIRRNMQFARGLGRMRRMGQGDEFESLRDYEHGDPLSVVDWKATARRAEPIVRNFQPEQRQNVLIAIDTGRATAGRFEKMTRLDCLVDAALMLSYVVLRQGDYLSLLAFNDRIESYVPPMRGLSNIPTAADELYKLHSRKVESDYAMACRFLSLRNRKRSLLCILTDVLDRQASGVLLSYVARFARRHLPLAVTLGDPQLTRLAGARLGQATDPFAKAVAVDMLKSRQEALAAMRRSGVDVLDVPPGQLMTSLVDHYLRIKSNHRL